MDFWGRWKCQALEGYQNKRIQYFADFLGSMPLEIHSGLRSILFLKKRATAE